MENQEINNTAVQEPEQQPVETLTIKFSRKLARPFTSKSGKDMVAIKIPNADPEDKKQDPSSLLLKMTAGPRRKEPLITRH